MSDRFWSKVSILGPNCCWLWKGATKGIGYGNYRRNNPRRLESAHRVAYEKSHGAIPTGLQVLHSCDIPACCNPRHLRTGTQLDNVNDCIDQGRMSKPPLLAGENNPHCRLTSSDVTSIRSMSSDGISNREIAKQFKISKQHVIRIVRRQRWAHLDAPEVPV